MLKVMNSTHYIYVSAFAITIAIEIVINDDDFHGTVPHVSFGRTNITDAFSKSSGADSSNYTLISRGHHYVKPSVKTDLKIMNALSSHYPVTIQSLVHTQLN